VSAFEQNPAEDKDTKRKSMIKEDVRVDTQRFNSFLNKFESKDQRAEAKAQMIKITKEHQNLKITIKMKRKELPKNGLENARKKRKQSWKQKGGRKRRNRKISG